MAAATPTLDWESELWSAGTGIVIGVDEVGRGAIAGPVAVGAVALTVDCGIAPAGIRDSKLLSPKRREALHGPVSAWAWRHGVGFVGAATVDARGIIPSLGLAAAAAVGALELSADELAHAVVLLDGSFDYFSRAAPAGLRVLTRVKADRDCLSVAAASILAKVERDRHMVSVAERFPGYFFEANKGYGSAAHLAAIREHGACAEHRRSWIH